MRAGAGEDERRWNSSRKICKSSSEEREMRESRSWRGSWYLRLKGLLTSRAAAIWAENAESDAVLAAGMVIMRVSPPE